MKPEHLKLLRDKLCRLNHLYWITDKEGKPVRFKMTPEQLEYFEGMHTRNIILKARQLGFTTEVCIIQLDAAAITAYWVLLPVMLVRRLSAPSWTHSST